MWTKFIQQTLEFFFKTIQYHFHCNNNFKFYRLQISSVPAEAFTQGLVLTVTGSSLDDLSYSNITLSSSRAENHDDGNSFPIIIVRVDLPPFEKQDNNSGNVRVTFYVFATASLFVSSSLHTDHHAPNSPVIFLDLGNQSVATLSGPINFTFTPSMVIYVTYIQRSNAHAQISHAHAQTDFPPKITVLFAYRPKSKAPYY